MSAERERNLPRQTDAFLQAAFLLARQISQIMRVHVKLFRLSSVSVPRGLTNA